MSNSRRSRKSFDETFGYVRQDLAAIRSANLGLNYTVVLLICCACQMLAWHKGLKDDQVFTSLLPDDERCRLLGKKMFEALRNGLAHRFRPNTIKVGSEDWRFSIRWQGGPPISVNPRPNPNDPNWLQLNAKVLEERLTAQIDAYQEELRNSARARANFLEKSRKCITEIHGGGEGIAAAWKSLMRG
jgi:hypothetical protein